MNRRHYHFKGGGLLQDRMRFGAAMKTPEKFPVPAYIDSKSYCLPTSNQGQIPACAGYAWAGLAEVWHWACHDFYEQIDGVGIWKEAHKRDGIADDTEGTTLESAFKAAVGLGYLPDLPLRRIATLRDLQYALHRNIVAVCGVMVTEAWNYVDTETGTIGTNEGAELGLHAILVCGYNEAHKTIEWQNSWLPWGCNGFGRTNYEQWQRRFYYGLTLDLP